MTEDSSGLGVPGSVIVLNGTSSSGKTSLAKELQKKLPDAWLHMSIDLFSECLPPGRELTPQEVFAYMVGVHEAIGGMISTGNRVIVDHVLTHDAAVTDLKRILATAPVVFVGVRCPVEVLEAREQMRSDRPAGLARSQFDLVHRLPYDLEIDTSQMDPGAAAERILDFLSTSEIRTPAPHTAP